MERSHKLVAVMLGGLVSAIVGVQSVQAMPPESEPVETIHLETIEDMPEMSAPSGLRSLTDSTGRAGVTQKAVIESNPDRQQVVTSAASCTAPSLPTTEQLVAMMAELPPLPKVHYSYPLHPTLLGDPDSPLLYQYVRLTRAIGLSSAAKIWQIITAVDVCDQISGLGDGAVPASIAINHSPYHNGFPAGLPPTYTGPEYYAEIDIYRTRLTGVRDQIAAQNASLGSQIDVSAILLNSERFSLKKDGEPGAAEWNAAIIAKYTPFYDIAKEIYPEARVEWYGRGIQESNARSGWSPFPWFTFEEPSDTLACSLYRVCEVETMRETFRRTCELAYEMGDTEVTPWIALGSGYRRGTVAFQTWAQDWDYDTVYSLLLGREVNQRWYSTLPERYAPWDAAKVVVFYPSPFDPRTPSWGKHFIAYARGAAGRNDLP